MSISYPRALPSLLISGCDFELDRRDLVIPEGSGRLIGVAVATPVWRMKLSATGISRDAFDLWRAWNASLKGPIKKFFGQDVFHRMPRWYRSGFADLSRFGGGAYDGTAATWSVDTARDALTQTGLPVGFKIAVGDYIGIDYGSASRFLVRALEATEADGGGVATVTVDPALPPWLTSGTATMAAPACVMRIIPGTWQAQNDHPQRRIAFEALQVVEPV